MFTAREIKAILRKEHIALSKHRGQNFLVAPGIQKKIIAAVQIKSGEEVLEIGPGLGALTEDLARQAERVFAVEKDRALAKRLQAQLSACTNLTVIHADILEFELTKVASRKLKVVGNLPYYITTPIIGYLLERQCENISDIFITVQEEVGQRMLACHGGKDYAALSVFVQYFTKGRLLFPVPKRAFYPQPKVNSVFMHLLMRKEPPVKVHDRKLFFKIIRTCFNQRRKTVLNSLAHGLGWVEKQKLEQLLKAGGIDAAIRPEKLSLADFARIEDILYTIYPAS